MASNTDRPLRPSVADVDDNAEDRRGTASVFNGPRPIIRLLPTREGEIEAVGQWLTECAAEGVAPQEIGLFVRSPAELPWATAAVARAGLGFQMLEENVEVDSQHVSVSTMHLPTGVEFRTVVVMGCDDEVIPLQTRIEAVADNADLEEVYNTERHLLYVAITPARDHLLVTSGGPASEFLDGLRG